MTISIAPARNEYTANAAQTIFNYTFKIFADTDLNVYITPSGQDANDSTDITTAYTVTGLGDENGGTIILSVGANANDLVTIVSNVPSSRTTDYQNNGDFRPPVVNADFDRVVSIAKKVEDVTNRTLVSAQAQQGSKPLSLPSPQAGFAVRWNGGETGLENYDASTVSNEEISADKTVINYNALLTAINDPSLKLNQACNIAFRNNVFDQGGGMWDVVLLSSVTPTVGSPTIGNIVACVGAPVLALVLRMVNGKTTMNQLGAVDNAATDNSPLFNIAKTLLTSLIYGLGDYRHSTVVSVEDNTVTNIEGAGTDQTRLSFGVTSGVAMTVSSFWSRKLHIADITLSLVDNANTVSGMLVENGGEWGASVSMERVNIINFTDIVLDLFEAYNVVGSECFFRGKSGVKETEIILNIRRDDASGLSNLHQFSNCVFNFARMGIKNTAGAQMSFDSCTFENLILFNNTAQMTGITMLQSYNDCWFEFVDTLIKNSAILDADLSVIEPIQKRAPVDRFHFDNCYTGASVPLDALDVLIEPYWINNFTIQNGLKITAQQERLQTEFIFDNGLSDTDPAIRQIDEQFDFSEITTIDTVARVSPLTFVLRARGFNGAEMYAIYNTSTYQTDEVIIGTVKDDSAIGNSFKLDIVHVSYGIVRVRGDASGLTEVKAIAYNT